jgi:hypothetical protein
MEQDDDGMVTGHLHEHSRELILQPVGGNGAAAQAAIGNAGSQE